MAIVGSDGLSALPGDIFLVQYAADVDPGFHHERLALWPVSNREWMILTPDGDHYAEDLGSYVTIDKISGRGDYPAGVEEVVAFELPLTTSRLEGWITTGRQAAGTSGQLEA